MFCNPLLHNIIQVKCLTLYEYASVKVISLKKKKKSDPSLDTLCRVGGVTVQWYQSLGLGGSGIEYI